MNWVLLALLALILLGVAWSKAARAWRVTAGHPLHWLRARLGRGLDVAELARRLERSPDKLAAFEPSYRSVAIPKRGGGWRRLLVPDPKTKALQRELLRAVLGRLRCHDAACGFERGRSIVDNARPHVGRRVVVRADVVDFFPSTSAARVEAYFRRVGWSREAATVLTRLTTQDGGLPQGAPTSPRLSNVVNFGLDVRLARFAARRRAVYTRYADDLTFSFERDRPARVRGILQYARRVLKAHGYEMHRKRKLHVRRRHQRQEVTGLVVNDKVALPRRTRRWLRAVRHRAATGGRPTLSKRQLAGWTALERMIETQRTPR